MKTCVMSNNMNVEEKPKKMKWHVMKMNQWGEEYGEDRQIVYEHQ